MVISIGGMMMWNGSFDILNAYSSVFAAGDVFEWLIWDSSTGNIILQMQFMMNLMMIQMSLLLEVFHMLLIL